MPAIVRTPPTERRDGARRVRAPLSRELRGTGPDHRPDRCARCHDRARRSSRGALYREAVRPGGSPDRDRGGRRDRLTRIDVYGKPRPFVDRELQRRIDVVRPAATGLGTAFFRLYLLEALVPAPARPTTLLAALAAEHLPLASGGFSRALQGLLDGGYLVPAPEGAVALTPLGAAERMAERERWRRVIPTALRLVGDDAPVARPAPAIAEAPPVRYRTAEVAESYLDRVLVAALRERLAQAREGGRAFALVLGVADIDATSEATRRAMVHRVIRATLGGSTTIFGGDTNAFRYGDTGVALVSPILRDAARAALLAALLRSRMDELLAAMTASVRAFKGARWIVRVGSATWTPEIATSATLLRIAQDALERDASLRPAA